MKPSRTADILAGAAALLLMFSISSFGATYDVITPKALKPAEKTEAPEADAPSGKNIQPFQAEAANPCPDETGWLLSTVPMTTGDKKEAGFSSKPGSGFLPEDMQKELVNIAAKENISMNELCGKLNTYKTRLEEYRGDPQEYNRQRMLILEEMLDCSKSCGKILNKFAAIYTESSRIYFSGIVRFNFGGRRVESSIKGDKSHGPIMINNEAQLKAALARWQKDPSQRIQLDARSSIPGAVDTNDRISKIRAEAVQGWLTARGVPPAQISIKWLGKYGPMIDRQVARAYNIEDIFEEYVVNKANQSTGMIGSQGLNSFFDGLNQSVCIFVLP
jgi:hypothetical protein